MAGITSSFHIRPILSRTRTTPSAGHSSPSPHLSLSSLDSKLFGLRLSSCSSNSVDSSPSSSLPTYTVTARYGGGGGGSRSGSYGSRRPPQKPSSDDVEALDISSIRSTSVRLIDEEQNMVGVVSKSEAIQMAEDAQLDLVILSPDADPPVVRIMDYNKYRYELQKRKREQQKKSVANRMDLKEVKMGYNIDSHDYSVRLKAAHKFLKEGDKVKVIVNLKGRENQFRNIAIELIRRFQNDVGELGTEESKNFNDRNINIVLVPNKAIQKPQDAPKKKEKSAKSEVSAGV